MYSMRNAGRLEKRGLLGTITYPTAIIELGRMSVSGWKDRSLES